MIDKDRNQPIDYDVERQGTEGSLGAYRASALLNATDPADPYEVEHPLHVGQGIVVSAIGSTAEEARTNLETGLRRWGFVGPMHAQYSKEYWAATMERSERAKAYKRRPLPPPVDPAGQREIVREVLAEIEKRKP